MEKGQAASPVLGPSTNITTKLKSNNSFTDSPSSNNCINACSSPSQASVIGSNNNVSPYANFNADAKAEDVVLPKNGTNNCVLRSGSTSNPFFTTGNKNSPISRTCTSPLTAATLGTRSHGNKRNVTHNVARRMGSVDSLNHKEGTASSNRTMNASKFSDKNQLRHSPRTPVDFMSSEGQARSGSASPFAPSPASFNDNIMTTNAIKNTKSDNLTAGNMRINHLSSRTSSNNSISDLSPCSAVTDENAANNALSHNNNSHSTETTSSISTAFTSECNITTSASSIADINIDNPLLSTLDDDINIDSLKVFPFSTTDNGRDDIGSNALNLSAEEVRQTLNSVSADSTLPEISLADTNSENLPTVSDCPSGTQSGMLNATLDFDDGANRIELKDILSSSTAVSMATTTSSTTVMTTIATATVDNSAAKIISHSDLISSSYLNKSNTSSTSTTMAFSSPLSGSGATKSHLQEILGADDTNRLKNMGRPFDPSQYPTSSSTSFSVNFNSKSNLLTSHASDRAGHHLSAASPSRLSPRTSHPTGNAFYHRMLHRTSSNPHPPHGVPMSHPYDMNHVNPPSEHPSKFPDHSLPMGPRQGMPYDQSNMPPTHQMHEGMPGYGHSIPGNWQRHGPMVPHGIPPGLNEGNKSPRAQVGTFPPKSVNPMSGLQSTVDAIPSLGNITKNNNNMGPPHLNQRIPTPVGVDMGDARMLPPPSPSIHDKRSVSADGSVTTPGLLKTKGGKRERGQSLDSNDKKESGPKQKRRKSRSKDDTKKPDLRSNRPANSTDVQATSSYFYVFNSDIANKAAVMVMNQSITSIIQHHSQCQGNSRLLPSKSSTFSFSQHNPVIKTETNSPHNVTAASNAPLNKGDSKSFSQTNPVTSSASNQVVKTEIPSTSQPSSLDTKPISVPVPIKTENESGAESQDKSANVSPSAQAQTKKEIHEESLTEEQRKHREESLGKIEQLKKQLLPDTNSSPSNQASWPNNSSGTHKSNYSMSRHLQKVQETNKNNLSKEGEWFRLVQVCRLLYKSQHLP